MEKLFHFIEKSFNPQKHTYQGEMERKKRKKDVYSLSPREESCKHKLSALLLACVSALH
jgi:hypothetical protein